MYKHLENNAKNVFKNGLSITFVEVNRKHSEPDETLGTVWVFLASLEYDKRMNNLPDHATTNEVVFREKGV